MDEMREMHVKLDAMREMLVAFGSRVDTHIAARDERERTMFSHITELRERTRKNSDRFAQLTQDITDLRLWRAKMVGMLAAFSFIGGLIGSVVSLVLRTVI